MGRNSRKQLERSRKKQLRKQANIKKGFIFEEGDMNKMSLPMPTLWLFLNEKKVEKLLRTFADSLPKSKSNHSHNNIKFVKMAMFLALGGISSPNHFSDIVVDQMRDFYGVKISKSAFYNWFDRMEEHLSQFEKAVEKSAELYIASLKSDQKGLVVDIDATYRKSDADWATMDYKGDISFRIMMMHVGKEERGAKAIFRAKVDPGNISPRTDIYPMTQHVISQHDIALFRSDSAAYNHKLLDLLTTHDIPFLVGAPHDESVLGTLGCIKEKAYIRYHNNNGIVTGEDVATIGHAMNKTKHGFSLVNKRKPRQRKIDKELEQTGQEALFGTGKEYNHYTIAVAPSLAKEYDAENLRQRYELRGGQEYIIGTFKQLYRPKARETHAKTALWTQILAIAYNLGLYFLEHYSDKKKPQVRKLPTIFASSPRS